MVRVNKDEGNGDRDMAKAGKVKGRKGGDEWIILAPGYAHVHAYLQRSYQISFAVAPSSIP